MSVFVAHLRLRTNVGFRVPCRPDHQRQWCVGLRRRLCLISLLSVKRRPVVRIQRRISTRRCRKSSGIAVACPETDELSAVFAAPSVVAQGRGAISVLTAWSHIRFGKHLPWIALGDANSPKAPSRSPAKALRPSCRGNRRLSHPQLFGAFTKRSRPVSPNGGSRSRWTSRKFWRLVTLRKETGCKPSLLWNGTIRLSSQPRNPSSCRK